MEAASVEFFGPIQCMGTSNWNHFRAPDGTVFEILKKGKAMKLVLRALLLVAAIVTHAEYARSAEPSADVSHLIQRLRDPDLDHRRDAASELSKISPLPP
jgi:precorrin-4 methylase